MASRPSPGSAHPAPDRPRQPREGDFEGLIAELTSEFKRLQWQLSDLASENEDLRKHVRHLPIEDSDMQLRSATAETNHLDQDCDEFVLSASVRPSDQVSDRAPQAACARSSMTGWSSEPRVVGGRHSSASFFAHKVEGTLKRERATELSSPKGVFGHGRDFGHGHEGQQSTPIHAHSVQDLHDDNHHRQISRSASSCKLRESIVKHMDQAIAQSSLFEKLDTDGKGELLLGDLSRILSMADETMECVMLVNIVRLVNGLDPVEVQHMENADDGDLMESHHELGLDVHAFTKLMDPALEIDEDYEDAVWTLRTACESQSHDIHSRGGRKTRVSFAMPLRPVDTEYLYQRRAPCLIETIVPFVILSDLLMMGLAADYPQHSSIWDLCEYIFVVIYTLEVLAKLHLHGCHEYFKGPERHWNWFDCSCLAVSLGYVATKVIVSFVQGQANTSGVLFILIRMLRLSRLARLVRTLRFRVFAELKMIVMGVVSGLRMLIWALVLLLMIIYVVAVAATNLFSSAEPEFKDMQSSMFTLYRCWTEGCAAYNGTPLSERLRETYGFSWAGFHVFMSMFIEVGLFNLIMAVFVDNVRSSQLLRKHIEMVEHSKNIERRFKEIFASFIKNGTGSRTSLTSTMDKLNRVNHHMMGFAATDHKVDWAIVEKEWEVLREMDVVVTKEVFNDWLEERRLQELLDDAEIIHANRFELFDILDCDMGGQLSMDELTTGLMKLRGDITKSDIVAINLKVRHLTGIMEGYVGTRVERLPSRMPSSEHHFSRKSSRHHTR